LIPRRSRDAGDRGEQPSLEVRKLVEQDAPDAWVTSFAELQPEVALEPLARAVP
jgi:hypothetical protein